MRIDHLDDIRVFVQIVQSGSLSAAAREVDQSLAVISKRLMRLEQALGTQLLIRTTRTLRLTEEGQNLHAKFLALLDQVDEIEDAARGYRQEVSGILRMTATHAFSRRYLSTALPEFMHLHPSIEIDLKATDEIVDITKDGFDIAIRQAPLPDSSLIARKLADDWRVLCAAPIFLERHGSPRDLHDVQSFPAVIFGNPPLAEATFLCGKKTETIRFRSDFYASSGDVAHAAAVAGAGVILKSVWEVGMDIRSGALEHLFPEWHVPSRPIYAVFPANRFRTARIKSFIRFLTDKLATGPEGLAR